MIAHLDCSSGISGDKFLGALLDAGFSPDELRATLSPLGIAADDIVIEKVSSGGMAATSVRLSEKAEATAQPLRHLSDIRELMADTELPPHVAERALAVFIRLAVAEADIHGVSLDEVHFHEIGALDTLLDVVGVAAGLAALGIERLTATPIAVGEGVIESEHGSLPVPAPATAGLLLGVPVVPGPSAGQGEPSGELTTPTGAALVSVFAADYGPMPSMTPIRIGYGAGTRELGFPNVARIVLGEVDADDEMAVESEEAPGEEPAAQSEEIVEWPDGLTVETVTVLETNIDHLTAEQLAFCAQELIGDGALDVWQTPIVMKKGRAAVALSVMCDPPAATQFVSRMHDLTMTLGVRRTDVERIVVVREERTIDTRYGSVRVKVTNVGGKPHGRPEYDDVARIARETGRPISVVAEDLATDIAAALAGTG